MKRQPVWAGEVTIKNCSQLRLVVFTSGSETDIARSGEALGCDFEKDARLQRKSGTKDKGKRGRYDASGSVVTSCANRTGARA